MKQKRRILSLLIALIMIVGLVPAAAFAADNDETKAATTATVYFTAQLSGGFLFAPQFGVSVSSDLAESYGYTDSVDGVSVLDVLVKAHELTDGSDFTAETAADYLTIGSYGSPSKQFAVDGSDFYGGFFLNHAMANDGTMYDDSNYNGTSVSTQEVVDGDLVEFFFYEDDYYGDSYNWFIDEDENYSREFTVAPGEDLELTLKSFFAMNCSIFKDEAEMVASDTPSETDEVQIYTVDLATGALTKIDGAVTDEDGLVTLNFEDEGEYTITAYGTEDCMFTQILSLTTIKVEKPVPAEDIKVTATISNAGEVVVPFKEITVKDLNADQKHDIDEAFVAVHEAFYDGGAEAGYGSSGGWLTKLWGDTSGAFGFYLNGESAMGATDPIVDGDYLVAYIYKDQTGWTDSFAKFDKTSYTGKGSITATLSRMYYGADYALVTEAFKGAAITVYTKEYEAVDASKYNVTDNGDGTYTIDFNESGYYLIQADSADPFIVPALAEVSVTVIQPGDPVDINVTIVNAGEVVVPAEALTVEDADEDGAITVYDALYAAHEEWFEGGAAAGFSVADSGWMLKFWGDESGAFGYYINNAMAYGITDPVAEGDYLVAYIFADPVTWSDKYATLTGETDDEGIVTLTLEKEDFDENWNSTFVKLPGATIKVYDSEFAELAEDAYTVTDNEDGTYTVELTESGDYIFVAYEDTPIVPPVYRESVTVPDNQDDETEPEKKNLEDAYKETGDAYVKYGEDTGFEAGNEWVVLGLARAGRDIPGEEDYLAALEEYIKDKANENEQLGNTSTLNSRIILTLTSLAQDATKFADHDLIKGLSDLTYVGKQGLNGDSWALLALDSHEYEEAEGATATREAMVAAILAKQHEDGGWSLTDLYPNSDVDITAMMLQALAPYYSKDADVKAAVDKALDFLSAKQNKYGGFGSVDGSSAESCAQVVVALTALGIDPATDERFVKGDWSATDALASYYLGNGQFAHTPGGAYNGLATEQAYYAMASYFRFKNGQTSLYDMTDVEFEEETPEGPIVIITDEGKEEVNFDYDEIPEDIRLTVKIAADVNDDVDDPKDLEIIWQQEVVIPEDAEFPLTIEFKVDEKYKDKIIYIYHYDAEKKAWEVAGEGKYETFKVTFDSLSPLAMVAKKNEAPNTGDASQAWLWGGICAAAVVCGAAVLITGKKRKEE